MKKAQAGDRVTVHYIGTLDNGRIFDQRDSDQPLCFVLGAGEVFPALEREILDMKPGEVKNICLTAAQAYGPRLAENLLQAPRTIFPKGKKLTVGQKLLIELGGDETREMRIKTVDEKEVLLDGNHDLAGCDLTFALKLVALS